MKPSGRIIEVTGYIKKRETLTTIESNIAYNTCVLESMKPFPGYHGKNLPDESEPRSLFLLIRNNYSFEDIARISKKIAENFEYDFNASIASIYLQPYTYNCLRIKYLASFSFLPELQEKFIQEGVKFSKYKAINDRAIIVVDKNFLVEEQEQGIYRDLENKSKYYIELPEKLDWEAFRNFTFHIKNNLIESNFDAALGVFYRISGIVDMLRIYDRDTSIEKMRTLKSRYEEEVRKSHK
ncbi:MAG: hypothetical protein K9H65_04815 [Bacteroidales bacterium]|nr:hypothetical protein [Bacteroidales bacterium]